MAEKTGNPDFVYEISCDQMCGKGHFSMRGPVVVETQEEFDRWIISKTPQYLVAKFTANKNKVATDTTNAGKVASAAVNNK